MTLGSVPGATWRATDHSVSPGTTTTWPRVGGGVAVVDADVETRPSENATSSTNEQMTTTSVRPRRVSRTSRRVRDCRPGAPAPSRRPGTPVRAAARCPGGTGTAAVAPRNPDGRGDLGDRDGHDGLERPGRADEPDGPADGRAAGRVLGRTPGRVDGRVEGRVDGDVDGRDEARERSRGRVAVVVGTDRM